MEEEIYKIKVVPIDKTLANSVINMQFKFELKIPFYYQPTIITDYLLNYSNNKIKFLNLVNVPTSLEIDRVNSIVNLEIPMGDNMILGFMYNLERNNITNTDLLYDKITKQREINTIVKKLIIPKINRNKKSNYGKKFDTFLNSIHLGEIIYGNTYNIDIVTEIELNIILDSVILFMSHNKEYEYIKIYIKKYKHYPLTIPLLWEKKMKKEYESLFHADDADKYIKWLLCIN